MREWLQKLFVYPYIISLPISVLSRHYFISGSSLPPKVLNWHEVLSPRVWRLQVSTSLLVYPLKRPINIVVEFVLFYVWYSKHVCSQKRFVDHYLQNMYIVNHYSHFIMNNAGILHQHLGETYYAERSIKWLWP